MSEADYVRSQAKHDREVRFEAITALRALEGEHMALWHKYHAAMRRIAELEFQRRDETSIRN